ncbi:MAG: NDP-sugar synthase [Desulfotalea sp.]
MKALIIIREKHSSWLREFFPAIHPAMIPICNKPLLEYQVDFVLLCGCNDVRIIVDEASSAIDDYFRKGDRWGANITSNISKHDDSIDMIIEKNSTYCADTPLLIMDGLFFVHYDKSDNFQQLSLPTENGLLNSCSSGSILFAANTRCLHNISASSREHDFALSPLTCLDDVFQINMQILQAEQNHYVLPGYGVEQGILLGQNVVIGKDTEVIPPVIIGDNVRLLEKSVIGPDVSVGSNVIVDNGTKIERSIICQGSYIGRDLSVCNKIISGKRIISPADGEILDISDDFLFSSMDIQTKSIFRRLLNSFLACLLFVLQLLPYLLLSTLRKFQGSWQVDKQNVLLSVDGETLIIPVLINNRLSIADKLFATFALDKFPLLGLVINGKMQLVGNRPMTNTPAHQKLLADFPDYLPGVFAYSEGEDIELGGIDEEIAERYHAANRGFRHDSGLFMKILFSNISTRENL